MQRFSLKIKKENHINVVMRELPFTASAYDFTRKYRSIGNKKEVPSPFHGTTVHGGMKKFRQEALPG